MMDTHVPCWVYKIIKDFIKSGLHYYRVPAQEAGFWTYRHTPGKTRVSPGFAALTLSFGEGLMRTNITFKAQQGEAFRAAPNPVLECPSPGALIQHTYFPPSFFPLY
jgi:hypothetical protein